MKVLITGAQGQLGTELQNQLSEENMDVISLNKVELDITDFDKVTKVILQERPEVVINCAAYTNVDKCEVEFQKAYNVNALGPKNIAIATNKLDCKIVHISTDYVFNGLSDKPYKEYDEPNPENTYGKSKWLGEYYVRNYNPKHFIIRTSWLYGRGNNFVRTVLKLAKEKGELNIVDDQIGTPTSTEELAKNIKLLMDTEQYGVVHGSCQGSCSWYDFGKKIFEIKDIDIRVNNIKTKELNQLATRPKYSVLDNYILRLNSLDNFSHWEYALEEYLRKEDI